MIDPTSPEWTEAHQQASEPDDVQNAFIVLRYGLDDESHYHDQIDIVQNRIATLERELVERAAEIERLRAALDRVYRMAVPVYYRDAEARAYVAALEAIRGTIDAAREASDE